MRTMFLIIAAALLLAIPTAALPLAVAPATPPPARTPHCPAPGYPDTATLLAALPGATYACTEELAAALRPRADLATTDALISLAATGPHALARRNALRTLGRLAESPYGSRARELVLQARATHLRATLSALLAGEQDNFLVQDAVWLVDSFFYPSFHDGPALERLAADPALAPALRYRAAAARARLLAARAGPLSDDDRAFIHAGLQSDSPGVRAAAALAVAHLRSAQLDARLRAALDAALATAWAAEPPLELAPDEPPPVTGFAESSPTPLTARTAIARARDRLAGGTTQLEHLRAAYEALALPNRLSADGVTLRSGLPVAQLTPLLAEITRTRATFYAIVGPELHKPIPGEDGPALSVLIFARQGIYRDYLRAFTPFTVDVDGIYDELTATLYTHARTPEQSANSLEQTLRHEFAHHLAGRQIFPGHWQSPGYHAEPKGWADEGLAELLAGSGPAGPAPRPAQLGRLCALPTPPPLGELLARRAGYDHFGHFDYDAAWALSYYLYRERPAALRRLYAAYRDGSYRLDNWPRLVGAPLATLEAEWHVAIGGWCAHA